MTLKGLFGKQSNKVVSAKTITDLASDTESEAYVEENIVEKNRFVPDIDYSDPNNFVKFGSAVQYYSDAITLVQNSYPYDGSLAEKLAFHNSATDFQNYFFENEYPRYNGHILLGESYGSLVTSSNGYADPTSLEYIFLKGGPHAAEDAQQKKMRQIFEEANKYDTSVSRSSNLELDGANGTTVEFWINKAAASGSNKEVIFDLWNSASFGTPGYGRFRVELHPGITGEKNQFCVEYMSGSDGIFSQALGTGLEITGSDWNQYSISVVNSGSNLNMQLYQTGTLNQAVLAGTTTSTVTGSMIATLGSLVTSVSGAHGLLGSAKLSASLDEFRFWKTKRTDKKLQRYWFKQVGGGTNDDEANVGLGVYYKFNEGIVGTSSLSATDATVLDYSGRVTNGTWTGYALGSRSTSSAIVLSEAAVTEFQDPTIYSNHPSIVNLSADRAATGSLYDAENNAMIYDSFPSWMTEDDFDLDGKPLLLLTQIIAEYFDDLFTKLECLPTIADAKYRTGKQLPFAARLLESKGFVAPEIFSKATIMEEILSADEKRDFEEKLYDVKNHIYQNIYNNLPYIYRSKGTEKSIRNLIRCFGVGDELVKVNLYADDMEYRFEDTVSYTSVKKRYVDFNDVDRFDSTVYQMTASNNDNSVSFISGNTDLSYLGATMQAEVIFPKKFSRSNPLFFRTDFLSCSLFGMHEADAATPGTTTFFGGDDAHFSVFAVRKEEESKDAYFQITSSHFAINLTSSLFRDVYDDQKWNVAVKVKSSKYPLANAVIGSDDASTTFDVEFVGYNALQDVVQEEFKLTASVTNTLGKEHFEAAKRIYVGAHRDNFTGSVLTGPGTNNEHFSDAKISSVRYWLNYIPDSILELHAKDPSNIGAEHAYRAVDSYLSLHSSSLVPQSETLALNWDFDTVTGSDDGTGLPPANSSDATFSVEDVSSGSAALLTRWGNVSAVSKNHHTGKGEFFLRNDTDVVQIEWVSAAHRRLPETVNSDDLINILSQDDETFTRDTFPVNHYFAVEKSMYQTLSEEMIKFFGTVVDFNNLIGEPINRYRQEYKDLAKLRMLFFEKIDNTPSLEKYVEFYKWIDNAITEMTAQLIPASANMSNRVGTLVESHVLERNKYWNKLPTLELKQEPPVGPAESIGKLKYNWKFSHAPVGLAENESCLWWKERAERDDKTGIDLNSDRASILVVTLQTLNRRFSQVYDLGASPLTTIDYEPKTAEVAKQTGRFGAGGFLSISASDIEEIDCEDA
jgi:hypothetical protein